MNTKDWLIRWFKENSISNDSIPNNYNDENYFENGWIDSMKFIELITDIEQNYSIKFSNDEFQDRLFSTINGLTRIIEKKIAKL